MEYDGDTVYMTLSDRQVFNAALNRDLKKMQEEGPYPGDMSNSDCMCHKAIPSLCPVHGGTPGVAFVDRKDTTGKPLPLLMPYEALVAYSKVSDYGYKKYGNRESWKHSTSGVETYTNAAARHLYKSQYEQVDEESSLSHLHHALWSLCAAVWHLERQSK